MVFFPALGAVEEEKPLEMAPTPNFDGNAATEVARTQGRAAWGDAGPESISWERSPKTQPPAQTLFVFKLIFS